MENHENTVDQNISSKTRVFLNEAIQNDSNKVKEEIAIHTQQLQEKMGSAQSINQFFVGEFPEWDLLPQSGFVRRIKKSKV